MSDFITHRADTRGYANHGWLKTFHSFSFSSYYNPERMHFGALRVLNDDFIAGGAGFAMHPHDNMEIVSIVLKGALKHRDNLGNSGIIRAGEVQTMTAGTGIMHSEANADANEICQILQIWVFPEQKNLTPRYSQMSFRDKIENNALTLLIAPKETENALSIRQNAWFYFGKFEENSRIDFKLNQSGNGIYLFVIAGKCRFENQIFNDRDGIGVKNREEISMETLSHCEFLIMELPMQA
jgi:redox-sensitive bicupin YhaK (pirin superfamily)